MPQEFIGTVILLRRAVSTGLVASALLTGAGVAHAQNSTVIDGHAASGVVGVNVASGNNNQQANVGVAAEGGLALSTGALRQHLDTSSGTSGSGSSTIAADAFAGSSGWIAVSGAAGNDNQQANLAAFAFGIEAGAAADTLLGQTRASTGPAGAEGTPIADPEREVAIGDGAFANNSGLVQVTLIGGDRNSSANTFAMSISGPASPNP